MNLTPLFTSMLLAITVVGVLRLRRFSNRGRITFECLDERQLDRLAASLELLRLDPSDELFWKG